MHYTSYGESESLPPEQYVLWGMMERSKSRYISNIFCLKMHSYLAVICLAASSAALTCSCAPRYFPYAVRESIPAWRYSFTIPLRVLARAYSASRNAVCVLRTFFLTDRPERPWSRSRTGSMPFRSPPTRAGSSRSG